MKVELDDDVEDHRLDCLVAEVSGSLASLTHAEGLDPRLLRRLGSGAPGYLVFLHNGAEIALHGVAAAAASRASVIDFVVVDGVQVRERRRGRRVPFVTRARLFPTDLGPADAGAAGPTDAGETDAGAAGPTDAGETGNDQQAIETFTLDLSEGGALLRWRPEFAEHRRYRIELFFAADPRPVRCEAVRARQTDAGVGVQFGHLEGSHQARLAAILAARREARLKRSSGTTTPAVHPGDGPSPSPDVGRSGADDDSQRTGLEHRGDRASQALLGSSSGRRSSPVARKADRRLPVMQDMSDLESALGESGASFRNLFDAAPNGMAVMALDGTWIGVNPALRMALGYDHQELLDRGLADVSHPDDAQSGAVLMRTLVAGEIPRYTLDNRYIRKDGSVLSTRVSATLIRDEAGTPQVAFIQTEGTRLPH